jgi:dUTPase
MAVVTEPPATVTAGAAMGLAVQVEDGSGNVDTSFSGAVTVALSNFWGGPTSTLEGNLTVNAVQGVATFAGLTVSQPGDYCLVVRLDGVTGAASSQFIVTAGMASQLAVMTPPPGTLSAGAPFSMTIEAQDSCGNVDPTFSGTVTIALANNPASVALGGTVTVMAVNGVASFSGLTIGTLGTGYTLQATASGLTSVATGGVDVSAAGIANQLLVTIQPPNTVTAGQGFGLVVKAVDSFGTVDTSFQGSVSISLGNNPAGGVLGGILTASAVNGVATFSGLTLNESGAYLLSVSGNGWLTSTTAVAVTPAVATQLVVSDPSGNVVAGSPFGLTVYAEDPNGNVDPGFSGKLTLALGANPSHGSVGGTLTATASKGVAVFNNLTISVPGKGCTLRATGTGLTAGVSPPFNVTNDQLAVTTQPAATIVAGAFGFAVTAENARGGVDAAFKGNVTAALISYGGNTVGLGGNATVAAASGVATFSSLTLSQPGTYALSVTGNGVGGTATHLFTVIAAPATCLQLTVEPPSAVVAGGDFGLTIAAEDAYGNVDPTFNGSITLALNANPGSGVLGGTMTANAVGGVATFAAISIDAPGSGYTLQATGNGLDTVQTGSINVTAPGTATQLVVTTEPPDNSSAGTAFGLTVEAEDSSGNIDNSFGGSVTLALDNNPNGGVLGGTLTGTAVHGVATFTGLSINQVGSYTISASASGLAGGDSNSIQVNPSPATQLVLTGGNTSFLVGDVFQLVVSAEDPFGRVDSTFNGSVTLSLPNDPSALTGTLTATAADGVATFSGLSIETPGIGYTLLATSSSGIVGTGPTFDVTNEQLVVTTQPPNSVTAGSGFNLTVKAEDAQGNVDTSFNGSVTVANNNYFGGDLGGTLTVAAVGGVATFSGLELDQASSSDSLIVTTENLLPTITNPFNVVPATASQMAVQTAPPSNVSAGAPFGLDIAIEDAWGNLVPSFTGTVTVALMNNPGTATLGGTLTVAAANGVADFPGLAINHPSSGYTLEATGSGLTAVTTNAICVVPASAAVQLVVTSQPPSTVNAGSAFGFVVMAENGLGAADTTFSGSVTVADSSSGTLGGALTATAVNGVATFSGLTQCQACSGESLVVTGAGLNPATTNSFTVMAAAADRLSVMSPDRNVLPGSPFGLDVLAEDMYGNPDPAFNGSITVALATNSGGGVLGGTLTLTAVNGMAIFSDLTVNTPGSGYTVQATSAGLASGMSLPFDVTNDQLVVTAQPPCNVAAGGSLGMTITAENSSGNVDTSFRGPVNVALIDYRGDNAPLSGTLTATAVDGVATFSGLTVGQAGYYALSASGSGVGSAATRPFIIFQFPATTSLTLSAASGQGTYGGTASPTATLMAGSTPVPNETVSFSHNGIVVGTATTNSNGVATFPGVSLVGLHAGTYTGYLAARFAGDINYAGNGATEDLMVKPATPTVTATSGNTTYTGAPQPYPNSDVTVAGANGLSNSGGTLSYTYNGAATVPTAAGSYAVVATFTPSDAIDYASATTWTINAAPAITSAASATFTLGSAGSFTVTTTGYPAAKINWSGKYPSWCKWVDNGDGTATMWGTPTAAGAYTFTIIATNGISPAAPQTFKLTVDKTPAITSAAGTTFTAGKSGSFTIRTKPGLPARTTLSENGQLPSGVTFRPGRNGTAMLSGKPAAGSGGVYKFTITASNAPSSVTTQAFTLTVDQTPAITSAAATTFTAGGAGSFTLTTIPGFPTTTTLSEKGTLPSGVTFLDNHDGTATLSGTPAAGTGRTYRFTISAGNGPSSVTTQAFTLTVDQTPAITSAAGTTFTVGKSGSFPIRTTPGFPTTTTLSETGKLPSGVTFKAGKDGTATLSGKPAAGSGGTYSLTITASNGVSPAAVQLFTLTVVAAKSSPLTGADLIDPATHDAAMTAVLADSDDDTIGGTAAVTVTNQSPTAAAISPQLGVSTESAIQRATKTLFASVADWSGE